jgi:hypothetical protein
MRENKRNEAGISWLAKKCLLRPNHFGILAKHDIIGTSPRDHTPEPMAKRKSRKKAAAGPKAKGLRTVVAFSMSSGKQVAK